MVEDPMLVLGAGVTGSACRTNIFCLLWLINPVSGPGLTHCNCLPSHEEGMHCGEHLKVANGWVEEIQRGYKERSGESNAPLT